MQKIKVSEIAPYLPYKVKARFKETNKKGCRSYVNGTVACVYNDGSIVCGDTVNASPEKFKLILRPLSDLTSEFFSEVLNIDISDEITIKEFRDQQISIFNLPFGCAKILFENHFDLLGLIERNLAIDINTLK